MDADYNQTTKNRYSMLLLAWIIFSVVWIWLGDTGCLKTYYVNYNVVENYSEVLSQHSFLNLRPDNSFAALVVAFVVGIVLLRRARRWWLSLLFISLVPFACQMLIGSVVCSQTTLHWVGTVEFDGRVYHLTLGNNSDLEFFSQALFVHECDQTGEKCRGREIARSYSNRFAGPKLDVDETRNQLRVLDAAEVLFTLDADTFPISIPQNRQPIRLENLHQIERVLDFRYDTVTDMAWSHDGAFLGAAGYKALWLHDFRHSNLVTETIPVAGTTRFRQDITNVAFDSNRYILAATGARDDFVRFWSFDERIEPLSFPVGYGDAVAFSPDGKFIATTRDRKLFVLDAVTFTELALLTETSWRDAIDDLVFSPNGLFLAASGSDDNDDRRNFVRVWDTQNGNEILFFRGFHDFNPNPLAIAPDSNRLAFSTILNLNPNHYPQQIEVRLHVWNLQENAEQYSVLLPSGVYEISDLVWTLDGKVIVSSDNRGSIQFWNAETGEMMGALAGETEIVRLLALSPDDTILATSDMDGTISLWAVPMDN